MLKSRMSRSVAVLAVAWRAAHPNEVVIDAHVNAVLDRMAQGYHASREAFAALAPSEK
jgi:hypothetical protein